MATPKTSLTLLASLRDPSDEATWQRFDTTYRPVLLAFARQLGLNENDADEAAQRTIVQFRESYLRGQYHRKRGPFRNWLLGIAKHEIADLCAEHARQPVPTSQKAELEAAFSLVSDDTSLSALWDRQWEHHLIGLCLQRAATHFSSRDLRIFESLTLQRQSVQQVAQSLNVTTATVYKVKHRVLAFINSIKTEFESTI